MVGLAIGIGCSAVLAAIISIFWVRGIDYMKENHPDYKGEDFLNWKNDPENENDKNQIL
jgi:hypothetical protein